MQPGNSQQVDESGRRQIVIIWAAMLLSVGMYFVVMQVMRPQASVSGPMIVNVLTLCSLPPLVASFALKSRLLAKASETKRPEIWRSAHILAFALCESAALMGVLAWFLSGAKQSYLLLLLGAGGMLLHYPRRET